MQENKASLPIPMVYSEGIYRKSTDNRKMSSKQNNDDTNRIPTHENKSVMWRSPAWQPV